MIFKPKFSITPRLNDLLNRIAVLKEKIVTLPILPKREVGLVRSARLRMIHSSTAIEGNPLNLREIEAVLQGKIVTGASEKDRLEIINYEKVMSFINGLFKKGEREIVKEVVLKIHQLTTDKILEKKESGHYRRGPVFVVLKPGNKVIYKAPSAKNVPKLMNEFIIWINSKETRELSPVLIAAIVHHQLVTIHPFVDGNGRVARALATLVLYLNGYDIKRMFVLEDYYNLDRKVYYQAIQKSRKDKNLTFWLEYFSQGLLDELQQVLQKVEHFNLEILRKKQKPTYLSERQRGILDFVAINDKIFRSDAVEAFSISPRTANRDLKSLVELLFLEQKGKGPKTHYVLKR